jgi:polyphosphate kinase
MVITKKKGYKYIHRDISWLSFNYRVLQEAKDINVPLFERLKFLAIYSSNLNEFFRVRVSNHRNLIRAGKKAIKTADFSPVEVLEEILKIVNEQQEEFSSIFENSIIPALGKYGIFIKRRMMLNEEQTEFIESFFNNNLLPFVQPVLLIANKVKPFLNNGALYLALELQDKEDESLQYAILTIPSDHIDRFIELPNSNKDERHLILLDDIIRHCARFIFPGYNVDHSYSIKLTRDAELYIDDEYSGDLVAKIRKGLAKRNVGSASRLVYDRKISSSLLEYLKDTFDLGDLDLLAEGRYHNNFDFFGFPDFGNKHLRDLPLDPLSYPTLEDSKSIFDEFREKDHLLYYPYHSYRSVVKFFEDAANDPEVTHIKLIQYRVASESKIMDALIAAVENGKTVSAFIEVKARFDEEANLKWGEELEKAGINVVYSFPGLKVHSKMALIRRREGNQMKIYSYLSTGNFHEKTAKLYTDFGLFTAKKEITTEAMKVFKFLESKRLEETTFTTLGVGQYNLKTLLIDSVKKETAAAKAGKPAHIILKMNSLQDEEMIDLLYDASNAGVQIKLIVRGICCLVPNIPGMSENIEAISIVDRYLEHARVFIFHNGGKEKMYLSSADWMVRNLHKRIETMFPILDDELKTRIRKIINIQLEDNVKARILDENATNLYKKNDLDMAIRSQLETYYFLKRRS